MSIDAIRPRAVPVATRIMANVECAQDHVKYLRASTHDERARADLDCIAAELDEIRRIVAGDDPVFGMARGTVIT